MHRTRLVRSMIAGAMGLAMLGLVPGSAHAEKREPDASEAKLLKTAEEKGPQRVLVRFDSMERRSAMTGKLRAAGSGMSVNHTYDNFAMVAGKANSEAIEQLTSSPGVVEVSSDTLEKPHLNSAIQVTGGDEVHSRGVTGAGQAVVVIDDGVDADHPFFGDRVVHEACFIGTSGGEAGCDNGESEEIGPGAADPAGENDHGTHVGGIAAGNNPDPSGGEPAVGVAPGADLIAIRAGDDGFRIADVVAALDHVLEIRQEFDIAAVNYSGGGDESYTEGCGDDERAPAVEQLRNSGIAMVVSAGNEEEGGGEGHGVTAPACIPGVVAVGNSTDDDGVASSSNRGPLLDVFAPGSDIVSSVPGGGYEPKGGTSMAAPHVTGAFALLSQRFPSEGPDELLQRLQDTGVPITYTSSGEEFTDPRIDLAAAIPALPPTDVSAGGPYETDEGAPVTLNASGQNVTTFEWDLDDDGQYDDATGASPTFDRVGQDGEYPIALRASGPGGSATDETTVTVHNVAPTVQFSVDAPAGDPKPENSTVNVTGRITDPGWLDELTGTVDFGPGETVQLDGQLNNDPPQAVFSFETSFDYGDNGEFTVEVCGRDDHERVCETKVVRITNVNPDPRIDTSEAVDTPEGPTIITRKGEDVGLSATTTDPGSDDLVLSWFYGQGGDGADRQLRSLVNPPNEDPTPSPSVQPREVTDETSTSYGEACVYRVRHTAEDDDGGTGADDVHVVVQNKGVLKRTATLWYTEYLLGDLAEFPRDTLECYVDISTHMSAVLGEEHDLDTVEDARGLLHPELFGDLETKVDRQLLAAWLNFSHGSFGIDDDVDTECNLHTDATFEQVLREAESVRLSGDANREELRRQLNRLEALNLCNPLPD